MRRMNLWDALCIHACYHSWNPICLILRDEWVEAVWDAYGIKYPGWGAIR